MTRPQDRQLLPGSTSTSHSAACRQVRAPVTSQHRTKQEAFWFYFHFHVDVSESSVRSTTHLPVMTCDFFKNLSFELSVRRDGAAEEVIVHFWDRKWKETRGFFPNMQQTFPTLWKAVTTKRHPVCLSAATTSPETSTAAALCHLLIKDPFFLSYLPVSCTVNVFYCNTWIE